MITAISAGFYLLLAVVSIPVGIPIEGRTDLVILLLVLALMPTYLTILGSLRRQMLYYEDRNWQELFSARSELARENLRVLQESGAALAKARQDILNHLNTRQAWSIPPLKLTDHPVANAILLQYAQRAKTAGTRFACRADLPIPDTDLSSLLTNLLSNALEAAQGEGSWIEVTMHIRGKYLFVECQNSCRGNLTRDGGDRAVPLPPGRGPRLGHEDHGGRRTPLSKRIAGGGQRRRIPGPHRPADAGKMKK